MDKTPLTTLKNGDLIYIVWADGVQTAVLKSLETYKKGDVVWDHARVIVLFQGEYIYRLVGQDQLFVSRAEADKAFLLDARRMRDALNKFLTKQGAKTK